MAIADQIQALASDRSAIRNAILAKGGTCPETHGFDNFATDIANIPFAIGSFTLEEENATMTVTGLPFQPNFIMILGPEARSNLSATDTVYGMIGYTDNETYTYHALEVNRTSGNELAAIWTSSQITSGITITETGFTIERSGYVFAKDTEYTWIALRK